MSPMSQRAEVHAHRVTAGVYLFPALISGTWNNGSRPQFNMKEHGAGPLQSNRHHFPDHYFLYICQILACALLHSHAANTGLPCLLYLGAALLGRCQGSKWIASILTRSVYKQFLVCFHTIWINRGKLKPFYSPLKSNISKDDIKLPFLYIYRQLDCWIDRCLLLQNGNI